MEVRAMMCLPQETYPISFSLTPPELIASAFERSEELRSFSAGLMTSRRGPFRRIADRPFLKPHQALTELDAGIGGLERFS
jgi:hypothetical protein